MIDNSLMPVNEQLKEKDFFTDLLESFVFAMALSIIVFFTLISPNQVDGMSMEPTLHNEDKLITNKITQWLGNTEFGKSNGLDYERGDIIIFSLYEQDLVKRVIAKEGDTVMIKDGRVYVNNKLIVEKYLDSELYTRTYTGPYAFILEGQILKVPSNSYFVMGDNRNNSKDSRFSEVGFINRDQVKGKVILKYWPFDDFHTINRGEFEELEVENLF